MIARNVRMTRAEWRWVDREALASGTSSSDYARVAAVTRASIDFARRDPAGARRLAATFPMVAGVIGVYLERSDFDPD